VTSVTVTVTGAGTWAGAVWAVTVEERKKGKARTKNTAATLCLPTMAPSLNGLFNYRHYCPNLDTVQLRGSKTLSVAKPKRVMVDGWFCARRRHRKAG
jgi:hypothetical protein